MTYENKYTVTVSRRSRLASHASTRTHPSSRASQSASFAQFPRPKPTVHKASNRQGLDSLHSRQSTRNPERVRTFVAMTPVARRAAALSKSLPKLSVAPLRALNRPVRRRVARQSLLPANIFFRHHPSIHSAFSASVSTRVCRARDARRATSPRGRTPPNRAREFPFVSFPPSPSSSSRSRSTGRDVHERPKGVVGLRAHPSIIPGEPRGIHPSTRDASAIARRPTRRRPTRCVDINVPCVLKYSLSLHPLHPLLSLSLCVSLTPSSRARSGPSTLDGWLDAPRRSTLDWTDYRPTATRRNDARRDRPGGKTRRI